MSARSPKRSVVIVIDGSDSDGEKWEQDWDSGEEGTAGEAKRRKRAESAEPCCICMDETDMKLTWLPCAHAFHAHCLQLWSGPCPICRAPF